MGDELTTRDEALKAKEPQRKFFTAQLEPVGDESRRVRFIISTGDVDRDNDIISADGWDLDNFKKNPVVLWAHSSRDLPIARAVEIGVDGGRLVAVAEFATHAFAETVFQLVRQGFLRATSVGFRALEWMINEERRGIDFTRMELLEFSVVPVPANQNALIAASKAGVDLEPMRQWVQDTVEAWPGELKLKGSVWDKLTSAKPDKTATLSVEADFTEPMRQAKELNDLLQTIEASFERVKTMSLDEWRKVSNHEPEPEPSAPSDVKDGVDPEINPEDGTFKTAEQDGEPAAADTKSAAPRFAYTCRMGEMEATVSADSAEGLREAIAAAGWGEAADHVQVVEVDDDVFELADVDPGVDVNLDDLAVVMDGAMRDAVKAEMKSAVERAMNELQGRLN